MSPPVLSMHGKFPPPFPPWLLPPSDLQITLFKTSLDHTLRSVEGVPPEREMSSSYLAAELPQRLASWPLSRTHTMIWINRARSHWFNLSFVPTFPSLSFSIQSVPVLLPWVSVSILSVHAVPFTPFPHLTITVEQGQIFPFWDFCSHACFPMLLGFPEICGNLTEWDAVLKRLQRCACPSLLLLEHFPPHTLWDLSQFFKAQPWLRTLWSLFLNFKMGAQRAGGIFGTLAVTRTEKAMVCFLRRRCLIFR